jgi:hypothetical protein
VQHVVGQAREPPQAARNVQVALQRHDAGAAQSGHAFGAGREREHAHAARQAPCNAKPHVPAAHDQDAGPPEAGRQGAEGGLV